MSNADVPAQHHDADRALATERAIDERLIKTVLKAGGILFLIFIIAVFLL